MPSSLGHPTNQEFLFGLDGTAVYFATGNSWTGLALQSNTFAAQLCDWSMPTAPIAISYTNSKLALFFPQLRTVTNWSGVWNAPLLVNSIETSTDATAADNGTWTVQYPNDASTSYWRYETDIRRVRQPWTVGWSNIIAVRLNLYHDAGGNLRELHMWGQYTKPGLVFWDGSADNEMPGGNLDFGDIYQASTQTRTFRIKNNSATTANNVAITQSTNGTGGIVGNLVFSDGGAFSSAINITSIAPGAISPVITARRTVAAGAALTVGASQVTAIAGSWT